MPNIFFMHLRKDLMRQTDLVGFGFFLFAALISALSAWQHPAILSWLYVIHNGLLAFFYLRRIPAKKYDRAGLWLGMIAAFLPIYSSTGKNQAAWYFGVPGVAGYLLILWSLITLGPRFGIAPADRGITTQGPYRILRHPMYLGELIFRLGMVLSSPQYISSILLSLVLVFIQCWRIQREELMIEGYSCYKHLVPWRLIPGVW